MENNILWSEYNLSMSEILISQWCESQDSRKGITDITDSKCSHRWERTLKFQRSMDGSIQMEATMSADLMCSTEGRKRQKKRQWSEHEMLCLQRQRLRIWHIINEKKALYRENNRQIKCSWLAFFFCKLRGLCWSPWIIYILITWMIYFIE